MTLPSRDTLPGANGVITIMQLQSPLGTLVAGTTDQGICLLEFADRHRLEEQSRRLRRHFDAEPVPGKHPLLARLEGELDSYFAGELRKFTVPLEAPGTPFQREIWEYLAGIPYGETRSYDGVARDIGRAGAQRAVGRANGDNRIAIVIPCHRVIRSDGSLSGYGGGLWRKRWLLELERKGSREKGEGSRK